MDILSYPFDTEEILRRRRSIKKELLTDGRSRIKKKIAVLCGSTADEIVSIMELFLLDACIEPSFFISEYNQYWQDAMFGNIELSEFGPDIIFLHTTYRNLSNFFPETKDSEEMVNEKFEGAIAYFSQMWDKLASDFGCPVIQNNFEPPFYRLLGNRDATDIRGQLNFVNRVNAAFQERALDRKSVV